MAAQVLGPGLLHVVLVVNAQRAVRGDDLGAANTGNPNYPKRTTH